MTARLLAQDGETVSGAMLRRFIGPQTNLYVPGAGVAAGYASGSVGRTNAANQGTDPDHFYVKADGASMVLTIRPGFAYVQRDAGLITFDPQGYIAEQDAPTSVTITANATGAVRNDTVALRVDQSLAPDATGSNMVTTVAVAGQAGGGLAQAPSDGALYYPLATVVVANAATSIAQANVTDKRVVVAGGSTGGLLSTAGAPTSGYYATGTVLYDVNEFQFICTAGGTPGTWRATPGGTLGAASSTGGIGPYSTPIAGLLSLPSVTVGAGRRIRLSAYAGKLQATVAGDVFEYYLTDTGGTAGTVLQVQSITSTTGVPNSTLNIWVALTPSAGAHGYSLCANRVSGSGTQALANTATTPLTFLAEDIGT